MNALTTQENLFWAALIVGRYCRIWRGSNYVQIAYERLSLTCWTPWGQVSSKTLQSTIAARY